MQEFSLSKQNRKYTESIYSQQAFAPDLTFVAIFCIPKRIYLKEITLKYQTSIYKLLVHKVESKFKLRLSSLSLGFFKRQEQNLLGNGEQFTSFGK